MSKLLKVIAENFSIGDTFGPHEISNLSGLDIKVVHMGLRRLSNTEKLGSFRSMDAPRYIYRSQDEINQAKQLANDTIDKYNLKQKKYKVTW